MIEIRMCIFGFIENIVRDKLVEDFCGLEVSSFVAAESVFFDHVGDGLSGLAQSIVEVAEKESVVHAFNSLLSLSPQFDMLESILMNVPTVFKEI